VGSLLLVQNEIFDYYITCRDELDFALTFSLAFVLLTRPRIGLPGFIFFPFLGDPLILHARAMAIKLVLDEAPRAPMKDPRIDCCGVLPCRGHLQARQANRASAQN